MMLNGRFAWPSPPIPIELTPAHRTVKATAAAERRGDPRSTAEPHTPKPGAGKKPKPPGPPPPPATADLKPFAPDDANLVVLLAAKRLRESPYREGVETLLHALPDTNTLLGGSGLSPIGDFDSLLIATANPRDVTATFLAVRFVDDARIRAIADRPLGPGDPRVFRFLKPGLAVLTRPESAAKLDGTPDLGAGDPRSAWVKQLEQFDQVAQAQNGPAVMATLSDVPSLLRFGDGFPTPLALALAITAEASPAVRLKAVFANEADAQRMVQAWPEVMRRYRTITAIVGLSSALDELHLQRNGAEVELSGRIPESQMRLAMNLATSFVPKPVENVPAPPPNEPPPETEPAPLDGGAH